ncbi:ABC transporter substrate-binding protein [Desulfatirhabdium butyrativorans]|uniref:ABC transporter substrate-binding protein n=1 Tax=Desulfatirhabdium butyrativorans TaxID=340467 RepID=UPI000403C0F2|nr:ABC transporter substrate-binding protein [Desulfatirhabdium butyrativorans]
MKLFATSILIACMMLPCPSRSALAADDAIRVAAIYALSGPAASNQLNSLLGIRCGVKTVNAAGGVLGKRLDVIEIDNRSTPIGSKQAAEKAVALDVAAIIGSAWSSHTFAIAPVAQKAGIPMITNISTHPGITTIGDYVLSSRPVFSIGRWVRFT